MIQMARIAHEAHASIMEIDISVGTTRRSLSNFLIGSVRDVIDRFRANVKSAVIKGRIDDEVVFVDLIKDRMQETVSVETEPGKALSKDSVYFALGQAYDRRRDELRRQTRVPQV